MSLSRLQKYALLFMAERYKKNARERVTFSALRSYATQRYQKDYHRAFRDDNFSKSLRRLVDRGMLLQHPAGVKVRARAISFQLTPEGIIEAFNLLEQDRKIPPVRDFLNI